MKVTSYEISKKLEEIGLEAETMFYWVKDQYDKSDSDFYITVCLNPYGNAHAKIIKAYDLETILEMLPNDIDVWDGSIDGLEINKDGIGYVVEFGSCGEDDYETSDSNYLQKEESENLATTAARLLIKLIEDKVLTNPNNKASDE